MDLVDAHALIPASRYKEVVGPPAQAADAICIGKRGGNFCIFVVAIDNISVTSTLSSGEFSIENLNYSYNIDSKLLTIDSSEMLSKVNIYNLLGQEIISNDVNGYNVNMNLSELNSSVYIVNVEGANNTSDTFKIIVK